MLNKENLKAGDVIKCVLKSASFNVGDYVVVDSIVLEFSDSSLNKFEKVVDAGETLQKSDLKIGDELICVTRHNGDLQNGKDTGRWAVGTRVRVNQYMLRFWDDQQFKNFLKINSAPETSAESAIKTLSFEGVLDLTVEAYKAGVINSMSIEHSRTPRIHISFNGGYRWFDSDKPECFEEYVDFIDSLYKESFVIESDSDIAKIKYGAEVELSNGNVGTAVVTAKASDMNVVKVEYDGGEESSYLNFFTLKGATVTQKRG